MPARLTWPFFVVASILGATSARTALCADAQGPAVDGDGGVAGVIGPDVIVGVINGITAYGSIDVSGQGDYVSAFAVGTTSCNIGDDSVQWQASTNQHPVIRSGMYRLKSNRFEQIGISWVKHGFFATNEVICNLDCQKPAGYTAGAELFPGCSDPYFASLNGTRYYLGPTWQINAHTGSFPYPPSRPVAQTVIDQRLQVHNVDLDPALNADASYYVDGHYITPDDAAAGNGNNNVSYRRINIFTPNPQTNPPSFIAGITDTTQVDQPAIQVWRARDSSVVRTDARVPGEGLFILAARVSDLGTGFWRYEYALYNMNSDRSGRSLTIPVAVGASVQNIGFHDVDYHSGEPWDGTDWASSVPTGKIVWNTDDFATNPNANALRWGTLYNFRFDSNAPPGPSTVTLGLFKPGFPADVTIDTVGPGAGFIDCNNNGIADACDVLCGGAGCPAVGCGLSGDCNHNNVPDECEADCNNNGIADSCDLSSGTSEDCNGNTVPDECEPDCNLNGIPDTCETVGDTDGDGINDCDDQCPLTTPPDACVPPAIIGCLFGNGICIQNYPNYSCRSLGGTPLCDADNPGSCEGPPCPETLCRNGCLIGDFDGDADFDLLDGYALLRCFSGEVGSPAFVSPPTDCLLRFDFNNDGAVDLYDFEAFEREFAGPLATP
ncbi:MAG: hypothetical protein AAB341_05090 [Planctomycetota bacterium]